MKGKLNIIKHWATVTRRIKIVPSAKPLIAKYVLYHTLSYVLLDAITIAGPSITMGVLLNDRCWNKLLASKYGLSGQFPKMVYLPNSQLLPHEWASCQIRKIAGCACAGNAENIFPRGRLQRKLLVSDPDMHHGTCVTHVPWCMSGSLNRGGGENAPGIPGACATHNITYLARGPWQLQWPVYPTIKIKNAP